MFCDDPEINTVRKKYKFEIHEQVPTSAMANIETYSADDYVKYAVSAAKGTGFEHII